MSWVLRGSSNPFMTHDKERNGFSLNGFFFSRGKSMTEPGSVERGVAAVCRTFWALKNKQESPCFSVFRDIAKAMISFAGDTEKTAQLRQEISDFAETKSIGNLLSDFLVQVTEQFTCFDDAQLVRLADIVLDLIDGVPFECHQAVEKVDGYGVPTVKFCRAFQLEHEGSGLRQVVFAHIASLRADADEHGDELATSAATSKPVMEAVS